MESAQLLVVSFIIFVVWILRNNIIEIQKRTSNKWDILKFLSWCPILLFCFSLLGVLVPLARIYRMIISIVLKFKLGHEYCNVLKEMNYLMAYDTSENCFIKTLIIIEYNKVLAKKHFYDYTKEILKKRRLEQKIPKEFFATVHKFMGYLFLRNIKIEIMDIFRSLPVTKDLDKNELMKVLKECFYEPLPLNGTALWDVYVGTQPLKNWRKNPNADVEYYPLFFRTHHLLADGINLTKLFTSLFEDDKEMFIPNKVIPEKSFFQKIIKYSPVVYSTCVTFLSCAYLFLLHKGYDSNDLHGKPYKHKEVLETHFDKERYYFQKVKNIKMMCPTVRFPQVLLMAYAASLYEYFEKHSEKLPNCITIALPVCRDSNQIQKILSGDMDPTDVTATNQFTFLQLQLPIDISKHKYFNSNAPLTSRLYIVGHLMDTLQNSNEYQISNIILYKLLGSLPVWFVKKFGDTIHNTSLGSFLPGPPKQNFCDVYKISDWMFWAAHLTQLGICITAITFDNHLAMGI
ncbi:hypothetical protein FQR65_LT14620 [Abscondita terminalis]|nr:hypothetical protein FQR65_LT14620 [Abscondita terminalis]